jgi:putative PIN family toxin of toxin-antitoxin system
MADPGLCSPVRLVLDTNVVLDWLVFSAPDLAGFREQVIDGRVHVITDTFAIDELRRVLPRRELKLDPTRQQTVLEQYCARTSLVSAITESRDGALPHGFPSCRDPDDNPFLALTYKSNARALVTKDRAVLRLRRRVRPYGFAVMTVEQMLSELGSTAPEN